LPIRIARNSPRSIKRLTVLSQQLKASAASGSVTNNFGTEFSAGAIMKYPQGFGTASPQSHSVRGALGKSSFGHITEDCQLVQTAEYADACEVCIGLVGEKPQAHRQSGLELKEQEQSVSLLRSR
jgi:hypothetical protein